jgi:hypothetical protein
LRRLVVNGDPGYVESLQEGQGAVEAPVKTFALYHSRAA